MIQKRRRILFTYMVSRDMQSFTRADFETLGTQYAIRRHFYRGKAHSWPDRAAITYGVMTTDAAIAWFGYEHARIAVSAARKVGRPSLVIMGGFEGSDEVTPGSRPPMDQLERTRYILDNATKIVAVSHHLRRELTAIGSHQNIEVIHNGVDPDRFRYSDQKENIVLTAGFVSKNNLLRKGHEAFARVARLVPEARFYLVGEHLDRAVETLREMAPANVSITGWLSNSDLIRLMQKAKVYVQLSTHEAFGCALAEAMSCGCVPVVTPRAAMPEVVGDCGYYVDQGDLEGAARAVRSALRDPRVGQRASERIRAEFSHERRRVALLRVVEELLGLGGAKT